jgi:AmiR/NasT family two-component response regulator
MTESVERQMETEAVMRTAIVVDDEPITRLDISQMLTEAGFSVVGQAGDGFDAIALCRTLHPDIVLMDVRMPVFDGLDAAAAINEENLAECIVLITAFSDLDLIERANDVGVSGYLVKPVEQRLLVPTIEVALAQSRRLKKSRQEKEDVEKKLKETREIGRANSILAKDQKISETEAYRQLQQMAMNKRCTIGEIARTIVRQADEKAWVKKCKQRLMDSRQIGEKEAFDIIVQYAREHGKSREDAAKELCREEPK